jgi:hypothetical protein
MTPDATLMGMLGSAFRIVSFSAIALFAVAVLVVLWLCYNEHKFPDE